MLILNSILLVIYLFLFSALVLGFDLYVLSYDFPHLLSLCLSLSHLIAYRSYIKTISYSAPSVGFPDDGHRNCPKHVEFYSQNKFEKVVHLVGFIMTIF